MPQKRPPVKLQTERVSSEAIEELYRVSREYYKAFPTISDEQLRFYICSGWEKRQVFPKLFSVMTARDTTEKQYKDALLIHRRVTEMQNPNITQTQEEAIAEGLRDYVRDKYLLKSKK